MDTWGSAPGYDEGWPSAKVILLRGQMQAPYADSFKILLHRGLGSKVNSFYSGSGLSFVSGAKGSVARPTRKIAHIAMAEYRSLSGEPKLPKTCVARVAEKKL